MIPAFQSATAHSRFVACSLFLLVFGGSSAIAQQSQDPPVRYTYSPLPDSGTKPETPPAVMRLCTEPNTSNDPRSCETWIWGDGHYRAAAGRGVAGILLVEKFTKSQVVFRLTDPARPGKEGIVKVYGGTLSYSGDSILDGMFLTKDGTSGQFRAYWGRELEARAAPPPEQTAQQTQPPQSSDTLVYSYGGDPQHRVYRVPLDPPAAPPMHVPAKLSECEAGQCGVWELSGATGHARWSRGGMASLTVDRFGVDGITIRRDDYAGGGTPGFTAVYTGRVFGDQIKGEVEWFWAGHWPAPTHGTWAATILEPADYTLLDPNLPCKSSYVMSAQEALERGVQAMNARNADAGVCWLRIAADQGDPTAEGTLAAILYKGVGVPVNVTEAVSLAQKAAAGGNYVGERCLSLMYGNGEGVAKDAAKAEYRRAKAQQDKLAAIEAEQQADEEFQRQQQEARAIQNLQDQAQARAQQYQQDQSMLMLQLLFGLFSPGASGAANSGSSNPGSLIGCAPGYSGCPHVSGSH